MRIEAVLNRLSNLSALRTPPLQAGCLARTARLYRLPGNKEHLRDAGAAPKCGENDPGQGKEPLKDSAPNTRMLSPSHKAGLENELPPNSACSSLCPRSGFAPYLIPALMMPGRRKDTRKAR